MERSKLFWAPLLLSLACGAETGAPGEASFAVSDLVAPTARGPHNVGTTLFTATMSGGRVTRVQAFYPTDAAPDPDGVYRVVGPNGTFRVRSVYQAAEDAVATPGAFPLLAWDHGGLIAGVDVQ